MLIFIGPNIGVCVRLGTCEQSITWNDIRSGDFWSFKAMLSLLSYLVCGSKLLFMHLLNRIEETTGFSTHKLLHSEDVLLSFLQALFPDNH